MFQLFVYVAQNAVADGLCKTCLKQLSWLHANVLDEVRDAAVVVVIVGTDKVCSWRKHEQADDTCDSGAIGKKLGSGVSSSSRYCLQKGFPA